MKHQGPVILIGFKGSGKSVIGRALAAKFGMEYADTDAIIEGLHKIFEEEQLTCREIFKKYGDRYFKKLELEAVREAFSSDYSIISFGGGTLMNIEELGATIKKGVMVFLEADKETLFERIMKNGMPAFFDPANPRESFEKFYRERLPVYQRNADITVANSGRKIDEVVDDIADALKKRGASATAVL